MDLCKYTEMLWKQYLLGTEQEIQDRIQRDLEKNIVIIGTGDHEFYEDLSRFEAAYEMEARERDTIRFTICSFWCREKRLGNSASLVYGCVALKGKDSVSNAVVDMNTRFSIVYEKTASGWKIAHIHQSVPYYEQRDGEYYPKTLVKQVQEAQQYAQKMEALARNDSLTGLLNHQFFFEESSRLLDKAGQAYCMVLDLDDFKRVNDSCGHQSGDEVLRAVGRLLKRVLGEKGIAGRIGGDEFAVFCTELKSVEEARRTAKKILEGIRELREENYGKFPGISIGVEKVRPDETVKEVFRRADMALYEVKSTGKNACSVCGEKI